MTECRIDRKSTTTRSTDIGEQRAEAPTEEAADQRTDHADECALQHEHRQHEALRDAKAAHDADLGAATERGEQQRARDADHDGDQREHLDDEKLQCQMLANIISSDPVMSARILALSNSQLDRQLTMNLDVDEAVHS